MAFFPILIDLEGAPCLVAGGGALALHKAQLLLEQGARVIVVAPEICPELAALPVERHLRRVAAEDAAGVCLVVDATGDPEAEAVLSAACRSAHIPYNCAGHGAACTAIFPAVHRRGRVTLAVSTLGASPAASAWLRDALAAHIPPQLEEILNEMERLRPLSRARFTDQKVRRRFLRQSLDRMLTQGAPLTEAQREELMERIARETEKEEKTER